MYCGRANPNTMENPTMNKFLEEFMSAYCRLEIPTAAIIPNMTMKTPPTIGSGMLTNNAPNLPTTPTTIMTRAPHWITRRLPT